MRVFDCFMFNDEVDILQCRLEELAPVVDRFVIVEAGQNHLGQAKQSFFELHRARFEPWLHKIQLVRVDRFHSTDPRDREHEQRENITFGLNACHADAADIVIQSDADEIPRRDSIERAVRMLSVYRLVAFEQEPHYFAVDWLYPKRCDMAPAAAQFGHINSFWEMRRASVEAPLVPNAGWHFSWLGGKAAHVRKIESIYEGPEITSYARPMIEAERNWRDGIHVDGVKMSAIDVDETFPAFVRERRCPESWWRPR